MVVITLFYSVVLFFLAFYLLQTAVIQVSFDYVQCENQHEWICHSNNLRCHYLSQFQNSLLYTLCKMRTISKGRVSILCYYYICLSVPLCAVHFWPSQTDTRCQNSAPPSPAPFSFCISTLTSYSHSLLPLWYPTKGNPL